MSMLMNNYSVIPTSIGDINLYSGTDIGNEDYVHGSYA